MAKTTSFRHLFDYCPRTEKLFDEIKEVADGDQSVGDNFYADRKKLTRQGENLDASFARLSATRRRFVGASAAHLDKLFFEQGLSLRERQVKISGAVTMGEALLLQFHPSCSGFVRELVSFMRKLHEVYDFNLRRVN